jgi:hypothetical protein
MCEKGIRWEIGAGGGDQLLEVARPVLSRLWHELDVQDAIVAVEWEDDAVIEEELAGHGFELSERPSQRRVGLVLIALAVRPGPALEVLASAEALTEDLERLLVGDVRDGSPRSVSVSIS